MRTELEAVEEKKSEKVKETASKGLIALFLMIIFGEKLSKNNF